MRECQRELRVADGTVIAYCVIGGDSPTVVILHGLAGSGREFLPTAHALALAGRRVILIDQRGHGGSTTIPVDTSRRAFVDDVIQVIDAEATGPVDLVGQSMGAHTAMLVAATRPDLVRRLVLLEGNQGSGDDAEVASLGAFFRSWATPYASPDAALTALGDSALTRAWIADMDVRADGLHPRFDPDVMTAILETVAVPHWEEWQRVAAPTLAVYAAHGMFTEAQKQQFVGRGRYATRVDLASGSHDAHLDAFDEWIAVLGAFIEEAR